mgnify:CR=1 FL=1
MAKLPKFKMIGTKDFQHSLFGDITFNGVTHSHLADFYNISEEKKNTLFHIQELLNKIERSSNKKMSVFLSELIKIHENLKKISNHNDFFISDLEVCCKCELHFKYQTKKQIESKNNI